MKKELKDYLPFYLGAQVRWQYYDYEENCWTVWQTLTIGNLLTLLTDKSVSKIEIQLRHLSDMTAEEFNEFQILADNDSSKMVLIESVKEIVTNLFHQFEASKYLLSKHFDLFGLIEAGLAVNAAELKTVTE